MLEIPITEKFQEIATYDYCIGWAFVISTSIFLSRYQSIILVLEVAGRAGITTLPPAIMTPHSVTFRFYLNISQSHVAWKTKKTSVSLYPPLWINVVHGGCGWGTSEHGLLLVEQSSWRVFNFFFWSRMFFSEFRSQTYLSCLWVMIIQIVDFARGIKRSPKSGGKNRPELTRFLSGVVSGVYRSSKRW